MIPKSLPDIIEADLLALIDARTAEGTQLEFKRQLPDSNDQGNVRFLKGVTAFANTNGGDLIYGIEEHEGIAATITPLELTSQDQVVQRFENLCFNGVEPRVSTVQFRWVRLAQGGVVLIVRVARSWNAPHRVTAAKHNHFYGRNAAGAFPMNVVDLRRAFTLSDEVVQRIRSFRAERLLALSSGQGPVVLQSGAIGVLHVIPLQAFTSDIRLEIDERSNPVQQIHPLGSRGHDYRLNLDGRLTFRRDNEGRSFGYAQLFRNGIVEAATVYAEYEGKKYLPSEAYEHEILEGLNSYLPALRVLGVETPAYVFFSLLGIKGYRMGVSSTRFMGADAFVADRDLLDFPEVAISDWETDPGSVMRPMFDIVWNAFGLARSFNYTEQGEWVGQR